MNTRHSSCLFSCGRTLGTQTGSPPRPDVSESLSLAPQLQQGLRSLESSRPLRACVLSVGLWGDCSLLLRTSRGQRQKRSNDGKSRDLPALLARDFPERPRGLRTLACSQADSILLYCSCDFMFGLGAFILTFSLGMWQPHTIYFSFP